MVKIKGWDLNRVTCMRQHEEGKKDSKGEEGRGGGAVIEIEIFNQATAGHKKKRCYLIFEKLCTMKHVGWRERERERERERRKGKRLRQRKGDRVPITIEMRERVRIMCIIRKEE